MNWQAVKTWLILALTTFVGAAAGAGKEYLMAPPAGVDMKHVAIGAAVAAVGTGFAAVLHLYQPVPSKKPDVTSASIVFLALLFLAACQLTGSDFQKLGVCSAKYDACFAVSDVAFKEKRASADEAMALFKACRAQVDADCVFVDAAPSSSAKAPPSASAAPAVSVAPSATMAAPVASVTP